MKSPDRRKRLVRALTAALAALLTGAAGVWLYCREVLPEFAGAAATSVGRFVFPSPPPPAAAAPETVESAEQALLAAANRRFAVPAPHGTAELLAAAEEAVRAVLPGEAPLFAANGLPGVGVTLLGDGVAEVRGAAALAGGRGKRLRYRVRVHFLPGKYLEAFWPEIAE